MLSSKRTHRTSVLPSYMELSINLATASHVLYSTVGTINDSHYLSQIKSHALLLPPHIDPTCYKMTL